MLDWPNWANLIINILLLTFPLHIIITCHQCQRGRIQKAQSMLGSHPFSWDIILFYPMMMPGLNALICTSLLLPAIPVMYVYNYMIRLVRVTAAVMIVLLQRGLSPGDHRCGGPRQQLLLLTQHFPRHIVRCYTMTRDTCSVPRELWRDTCQVFWSADPSPSSPRRWARSSASTSRSRARARPPPR